MAEEVAPPVVPVQGGGGLRWQARGGRLRRGVGRFQGEALIQLRRQDAVVEQRCQAALQGPAALTGFTVMLQKEVAERMVAQVGDDAYGRLSIILQQYCDAAILFEVPASAFTPPPKVTSAILRARILETPREEVPLKALERVVASAFNNRRKMLRQSLKALNVDAIALCTKAGINETLRAEQCSLAMFAELGRAYDSMVHAK